MAIPVLEYSSTPVGTPVFWPGEVHGLYSTWGRKESDMSEQLSLSPCYFKVILYFNFKTILLEKKYEL